MARKSFKDSLFADSFASIFLLIVAVCAGSASGNKEGYYGKYLGKLSQLHHGVSGDVFAVDARTLHLRNFNYDGEGPAAYFYAGNTKGPGVGGFRLRDERGTTNVLPKYRNKHITITLPEGKTLQHIRWFSVWCDEFSVNFGDVKIPKNLDFPKPQKINGLSGVHGVSSEPIVIVDAQTLLIPSFSYDGEAPDAKFWVGRGFKPSPQGIRIPDENGKEVPLRRYDRKTIVLTLPGDLTIFDIGHFGVWCEAFTVDFGHVQIPRGLNIPPSLKMLGVSPQKRSPIALPLATLQNGFGNQFGGHQTTQPRVNFPVFYQDFNPGPFQDVKPTTYRPPLFSPPPPPPPPNYNSVNNQNRVEIQRSISLPSNNEFIINENTGDFVKKPFEIQHSRRLEFRYEPTPAEKILQHNPADPAAFRFPLQGAPPQPPQPLQARAGLHAPPLFPPPQFQQQPFYPQHQQPPPQFQQQPPPTAFHARATDHYGTIFNQQNVQANINHPSQLGLNSFSRFAINRSSGQGGFYQKF